jgi:preprotein translocase subunit YajC
MDMTTIVLVVVGVVLLAFYLMRRQARQKGD